MPKARPATKRAANEPSHACTGVYAAGQPPQKSYLELNDGWPLDSWSVTEPSNGYPVKHIRLLSKLVD